MALLTPPCLRVCAIAAIIAALSTLVLATGAAESVTATPAGVRQLYETIITTDGINGDAVLYGVPTTIASMNGDRMFLLNLSFIDSNVTHAKFHFYHKKLSPFRFNAAKDVRLAVYLVGKNGQPQRGAQYVTITNLTRAGWTEVDFTEVINRLLRSAKRPRQLSVALQFEQQQRSGKMHQVAPNKFVIRRNVPYVVFSSATADTSNFYNWFEAMLRSGSADSHRTPKEDGKNTETGEAVSTTDQFWNVTDAENATGRAENQADSPLSNLFGVPLYGANERVCSVRPWTIAVPKFLQKYIIHPKVLEINRCTGSCVPGVSPEDFRSSLIARAYFDQLGRTSKLQKCCVPDKLGALEMVFLSAKDSQYVMSRVAIPNLVAESCKCAYSYA